jgi:N-acyl-D-amino-acid deacylase
VSLFTAKSFLIKNGNILDGTGNPPIQTDILIDNGKIKKIAPNISDGDADEVIDASNLIVSPGFIDIHTHSDLTILYSRGENVLTQGVTTHVVGNCGFSMVPPPNMEKLTKDDVELFKTLLAPVLGMEGLEFKYRNLDEYLEELKQKGIPINLIPLIGHSNLRAYALGLENRAPSPEELQQMKTLLSEGLEQGAFGMSTGLDYPPGSLAKTDEIIELCKIVKKYDGIYTSHFRGFGSGIIRATKEAIKIAKTGVPVEISHFKPFGFWYGDIKRACKLIEKANEEDLDITFDVFPHASNSTFLLALVPPWIYLSKEKIDIPKAIDTLKKSETDKILRERINKEIDQIVESFLQIKTHKDWNIVFLDAPKNQEYTGKTIYQISIEKNMDPRDTLIKILIDLEGAVNGTYLSISEEDNLITIAHPLGMVASDGQILPEEGNAFPNPYCNGTFTQVLGKYVREEKLLTLPDAIRRMTSMPAKKLGLKDRGLLKEGNWADITIFDSDTIIDKSTYENPRLYSEGVEYVFVNGVLAYNKGVFTGSKSGMPLRKR